MKKMNGSVIAIILLVIAVIGLGSYIAYDKYSDSKDKKEVKENEKTTEKVEYKIASSIYESTGSTEDYLKIYLTEDNKVIASTTELKDKVVETDVEYVNLVYSGASDVCYGNMWVVIQKADGTIKAFSVDSFACGNKVVVNDITDGVRNLGIKTIKRVYYTSTYTNEYEPNLNKVFMVTDNNKQVEITSLLK